MSFNRKKTIIVAILVACTLSISGCFLKESGDGPVYPPDTENPGMKLDNKVYEPTKEILNAKPEDGKVQICDKVYTLPFKYSDLKKDTDLIIDKKESINEGMRLDKSEGSFLVRIDGSKVYLAIGAKKPNSVYTLDDAYVYGVYYSGEETRSDGEKGDLLERKSKNIVIFAGGITVLSDTVSTKEVYKYKEDGYIYDLPSGEKLRYIYNKCGNNLEEENDKTIDHIGVYIPIKNYINPNW